MSLSDEQLHKIADEVVKTVFQRDRIGDVQVTAGTDTDGDPAYFFEYRIEQDLDRETAARERLKLSQSLRDKLIDAGDETYPYVRVRSFSAACKVD